MKVKYLFYVFTFFALLVACSNELKESDGNKPSDGPTEVVDPYADGMKFSISRRYMVTVEDEQINGYSPLAWNEDAQITVNGFVSEHTAIDAADAAETLLFKLATASITDSSLVSELPVPPESTAK